MAIYDGDGARSWAEDERAIARLVQEYTRGADDRDLARFRSVWHSDSTWGVGPGFTGLEAISRAVQRQWTMYASMRHQNHNLLIDITDATNAIGSCDVTTFTEFPDGRVWYSVGSYRDRYQRRDGAWRIARRDAEVHLTLDVTALRVTDLSS